MKISILIDLLVPGGVQKAAIEEVRELRKLGHDAKLFCLTRARYDYQYEDLLQGLSATYLSDHNPWPFRTTRKFPLFSFLTTNHLFSPLLARRYSQLTRSDLVISHGTTTCLTAWAIKRQFGVPYIAFIWDPMGFILHTVYNQSVLKYLTPLLDPVINFLERRITREAMQVLTPSSVHKRRLEKAYGVKAAVIAPGQDFSPTKISKIRTYILGYSRWQKEKHPGFFLKLARLPRRSSQNKALTDDQGKISGAEADRSVPIVLAGLWTDKAELNRFRETIAREQLNIKLIGKVTQEDIPKLAAGAIAWVHPHFEAFGMPGLELAAHGVPIVIIQGSGVTDLFKDGVHGYFPPSRKAMIKAVQKLVRNKNKALEMGKAAMEVAKKYTWEFHTRRLISLIRFAQKKSPSILILHNAFVTTKSIGGGDRFTIEIAKRLKNHKLTVITPEIGYHHWRKSRVRGVRFKILPVSRFDENQSPLAIFLAYLNRSLKSLKLLNTQPKPDILVSATEHTPDILPAFMFIRTHPKTAWIVRIFHIVPPPQQRKGSFLINIAAWVLQRISLFMMRSCDRVIVDNPSLAKDLFKLGIPEWKIAIHQGGVDVNKIRRYQAKKIGKYEAAFVGRFIPHKGIFDLVPIWKRVVNVLPHANLVVIGTGPEKMEKQLVEQIRRNKLEHTITLLGFREHEKGRSMPLFDVLKNTKLLLFTDHEAGFGLSVAEAMASGLPVVAYNLPIFGSTYKEGFLTAPLGNTQQFASRIINLLKNQMLYRKLSREASQQAKAFDWSIAAKRFAQTLKGLQ